jgi:Fuc2NAc and GlcNAc transferase
MLAAVWVVFILGGLPPLQVGTRLVELGLTGDALAVLAIVWVVNLFNFMDGIDGIAGSEALIVCVAGGAIAGQSSEHVAAAAWLLAGASAGFLAWNWPPARIFMGDVGSGFLGFFIAVLALAAARSAPASAFVWLILGGTFFVDATVTFLRRLLRGVRVYEAHREHAYQWLSRRWQSHAAVDWAFIAVNVCWLAPWAWFAATHPEYAALAGLAALLPLVVLAVAMGAGRPE